MSNTVIDKSELWEKDSTESDKFEGLSVLQEEFVYLMNAGESINSIRKKYGVSWKFVKSRVSTVAFTQALTQQIDDITTYNMFWCRKQLIHIVNTSKNENAKIKALQTIIQLEEKLIPCALNELLTDELVEDEEGQRVLEALMEKYHITPEDLQKSDDGEEE